MAGKAPLLLLLLAAALCACTAAPVEVTRGPQSPALPITDLASLPVAERPRRPLAEDMRPMALAGETYAGLAFADSTLYLINVTTGEQMPVTQAGVYGVALSERYLAWLTAEGETSVTVNGQAQTLSLSHISVQDRTTGEQKQITDEPAPRQALALDGDRLVWMDKRHELTAPYTDYDIYAYDLATETEYAIAVAPGAQQNPAVHGNLIVWADNRHSPQRGTPLVGCGNCAENRFDIYLYDFATGSSRPLVENEWLKANPVVDGQRVVWEEFRAATADPSSGPVVAAADLYMMDLAGGEIQAITATPDSESSPSLTPTHLLWMVRVACDVIQIGPGGQEVRPATGVYVLDWATHEVTRLTDYVEPWALLAGGTAVISEGCMTGWTTYAVTLPAE